MGYLQNNSPFISPKTFKATASIFSLVGEEAVFNRNWPVKSAEYLENPIIFLSSTLKLHSYMFRITAYFRLPPLFQLLR